MTRVLLLSNTTGYQLRAFNDAAERLGIELVFATDRCHQLDDPWQDRAIAVRFHERGGVARRDRRAAGGRRSRRDRGRRPAGVLAARVAERLGLPWHSAGAARGQRATSSRLDDGFARGGPGGPVGISTLPARRRRPTRRTRIRASRFPASSSRSACRAAAASSAPTRRAEFAARLRAHPRAARAADVRAARTRAREHESWSSIHRRPRVRDRRGADRRRAAGLRDLRQARSARRPVLRRDDLRDAVALGRDERRRLVATIAARDATRSACGTGRSTPSAASAGRRLRARSRGAADRRPVLAGAAVRRRRTDGARGVCSCGTRSATTSSAYDARGGGGGGHDDSDPAARDATRASTARTAARAVPDVTTCASPRRRSVARAVARSGQLSGVHLRAGGTTPTARRRRCGQAHERLRSRSSRRLPVVNGVAGLKPTPDLLGSAAGRSRAAAPRLRRRRSPPCASSPAPAPLSARASAGTR